MADIAVHTTNRVSQWADDEFYEYVRMNPFKALMGTDANAAIQVKEELMKEAGDSVTFSFVTRLTGNGVTGDSTLTGNEEALGNYGQKVFVDQIRNAVIVGRFEKIKTKIDLLQAARVMLRQWNMEKLRDLFIARWLSPHVDGTTTYAAATATERNAWAAANNPATTNERILYGTAKSNYSGVHATDLATIDGTNDDMHQNIVRLIKRMCQSASPNMRPLVSKGSRAGSEQFVLLMGSLPFRDLSANFETVQANAGMRGDDNPIFSADDLKIGNVICKEVPELDRAVASGGAHLGNVGASGTTPVEAAFLVGAQSLFLAWGDRMKVKTDEFDYENRRGVAVAEIRGCAKASFNSVQIGTGTVFVSAAAD